MNRYAYIRVSSKDQNIARQVQAMSKAGLLKKQMYIDKQSGKNFNRQNYQKLLKKLNCGDELYIKSIDRLGRNYEEIIEQWHYLTNTKGIHIIVLDFPLLDTRNQINGITGKFIADLVLQVLSYVAQIERENIHERQMEGIRIAQENGIRFGRPKKEKPKDFDTLYTLWEQGKISLREASRRSGVSNHTFSTWINEKNNKNSWEKM